MQIKSRHDQILNEFYKQYEHLETNSNEFTWDGPSNWDIWEREQPKILFLVKEARQGAHPSVSEQKIENKFVRNIARWKFAIQKIYIDKLVSLTFPSDTDLPEYNDDIAVVEVKKLNEENDSSNNREIFDYAFKDKILLRQQIDLINPDIVICCSTFDCYDVIYDYSYDNEEELVQIEKCGCWKLNNRLVVDFYHPSIWQQWIDPNTIDRRCFDILCKLFKDEKVQGSFIRASLKTSQTRLANFSKTAFTLVNKGF